MAILKGHFVGRVFSNWHGQFHVLHFKENNNVLIAIYQGDKCPIINDGKEYYLQGSWRQSRQYGWQFFIRKMEETGYYKKRHQNSMDELKQMIMAV